MGIDMVNNIVNEMMNSKVDNTKAQSTTTKKQVSDFNSILKDLKSDKVGISKLVKDTKEINLNDISQKTEKTVNDISRKVEKAVKDNNISNENIEVNEEEIEEKIENLSIEQIIQCLSSIIDKVQNINENSNVNLDELSIKAINTSINEGLMSSISDSKNINFNMFATVMEEGSKNDNAVSIVNNFLEMLNENNIDEFLDKDNLSLANSLITTLGIKLNEEGNLGTENSFLKNLVLEVKTEINKVLQQDSNVQITNELQQVIVSDSSVEETKVTNNIAPIENKAENEASTIKNEVKFDEKNAADYSDSNKDSNSGSSNSENSRTSFSRDEKILNSILKGSNSNSSSFVMPVTTTVIQNNGGMAVTEVQVINKGSMVADVIKTVKFMTTNDMKEMVVKINPNNLGEVTIKLIEENGIMKMNIKASSKETYSLLSSQANEMKAQLNEQNIKIQDVNISLYEDDTTFFKEGEFNNNSFNQDKKKGNNIAHDDAINNEEDNESSYIDSSVINMLA